MLIVFSSAFIIAIKDSLVSSFWYKNELKEFIKYSITDSYLVGRFDWISRQYSKRELVDLVVDAILKEDKTYKQDIYSLAQGLVEINRYPSLEKLHDRNRKILNAKKYRDILKKHLIDFKQSIGSKTRNEEYQFYKAEYERRVKKENEEDRIKNALRKEKQNNPDLYYRKILKIVGRISKKQIKENYLQLLKLYHPDKYHNLDDEFIILATNKTKEINEAYAYLKAKYGQSDS